VIDDGFEIVGDDEVNDEDLTTYEKKKPIFRKPEDRIERGAIYSSGREGLGPEQDSLSFLYGGISEGDSFVDWGEIKQGVWGIDDRSERHQQ